MAGINDLLGPNGFIRSLFEWQIAGQLVQAIGSPYWSQLQQDVSAAHPVTPIDPSTAADLAARGIITVDAGQSESARSGIDGQRWAWLHDLHTVRVPPADLATGVLRSYITLGDAQAQAAPQGVTPDMLALLVNLAGDAPGPQDAARALQRGLIPEHGAGPDAVSFDQAIRESRLHDKYIPMVRELARVLLSPAELASGVVRNFVPHDQGVKVSGQQGMSAADFDTLVRLSGDAPAPGQLAEALRRGLIPAEGTGAGAVSFAQGIAEGRLADKWTGTIKGLSLLWPTPTAVLDAWVKGQLTDQQARDLYVRLGGDEQFITWLYGSLGEAPTPLEAAAMAERGIIPWQGTGPTVTSYEQAVKESHYRNKWEGAYRDLAVPLPAPSTVGTFLQDGAIDRATAATLLGQHGYDQTAIEAFIHDAEINALSDYRGLTKQSVADMYYAQLISADLATQILVSLHMTEQAANLLLAYVEMRRAIDQVTKLVSRVGTMFVNHKITVSTATQALTQLGVPAQAVQSIIYDWQITASANVKTLTATQIVDGWYYTALTQDEAIQQLQAIGYTAFDAWVLLSNKAKGPIPGRPEYTAALPQGAVIPGVT